MDAFKQNEILRMQHGGNKAWQAFYNANIGGENGGKCFEASSIKERYESDVGDEWKERLSAKVEDKDFDREAWKKEREAYKAKVTSNASSRSQTPNGAGPRKGLGAGGVTSFMPSARPESPASMLPSSQKQKNEAYFSQLGASNATRPENLPPSQGGRFAGFGSSPPPSSTFHQNPNSAIPTAADFQADPIASLSTSLSWFTTSLSRTAKTVNESYIQPTAKNIAASDLAAQARAAALQAGTGLQSSAKSASESFNRFVEGQDVGSANRTRASDGGGGGGGGGAARVGRAAEPERKDFWDSFGEPAGTAEAPLTKVRSKPSSIGTVAMKKVEGGGGGGINGPSTTSSITTTAAMSTPTGEGARPPPAGPAGLAGKAKGKDDGWDDW